MNDPLRGGLIRLTSEDPETAVKLELRWQRDTEFHRLADDDPAELRSEKKIKEWMEKQTADENPHRFSFSIRTLEEDRLIGFISLYLPVVHGCDAWVGIGIGDREFWGRGYGTDAMRVILRYAFTELNLHHVSLGLHAYNQRALRSYEKAGFQLEGRVRGEGLREGQRFDAIYMGILRKEWMEQNGIETRDI